MLSVTDLLLKNVLISTGSSQLPGMVLFPKARGDLRACDGGPQAHISPIQREALFQRHLPGEGYGAVLRA